MKILLTGATGYIGKRLIPLLVKEGHQVVCLARDTNRVSIPNSLSQGVEVIEVDLSQRETLEKIPNDIEVAFYLVHSMSTSKDYESEEQKIAFQFKERLNQTKVKQVIYLSGIINEEKLSPHLKSRKKVEETLKSGNFALTTLRAGIIIGSGSASFEIIRDLVEKLPLMITPKWVKTKCQPIAIRDVLSVLIGIMGKEKYYNQSYDIGAEDVLSYRQMLLQFAKVRKLKRTIITVPVMTPRLSSYWLFFVTSTPYRLAVALVDSMKIEVVCTPNNLLAELNIKPLSYRTALEKAFTKIENNAIVSSWKDAMVSSDARFQLTDFIQVPVFGCFLDKKKSKVINRDQTMDKIWQIGGDTGWYVYDFLWKIRGWMDRLIGGVGLRRGRTNQIDLQAGDALDFWRILYANKQEGRLLLFAEMKVPGEAWLEFKIEENTLIQTATFRPKGLWGRIYWWSVFPFHGLIFRGLINHLTEPN